MNGTALEVPRTGSRAPRRGMGRVFPRGETWWIAYYRRGKEYRESSGSDQERDAWKLLKKRLGEIGGQKFIGPRQERVTVDEILDALEAEYKVNGRKSLVTLRANKKALIAAFGGMKAVDVTPAHIRRVVAQWQEEGTADGTINRRLAALKRAYSLAVQDEKLSGSPAISFLKEKNARQGFFSRGEFLALVSHLPEDLRDFTEWAYWTGMRKGESAALTWAAFDKETRTLRLHGKDAKTGKARKLALEGPLWEILERRIQARRLDSLFIFQRDGQPIREFRKAWATACKKAGLTGRRFHDLRRTAVRNLVRAGVPQSIAMEISGHRTAAVFRRYDITSDEDIRTAVLNVSAYVESLPAESKVIPLAQAVNG